jgi:hypothetical protein
MQQRDHEYNNSNICCLSVEILHQVETMVICILQMLPTISIFSMRLQWGRTKVRLRELLSYEGYSDQWEVYDFTLIAFVECSCWCWVGEPENGTSLLWQHLNILQDKKHKDQSITMNAKDNDWYNGQQNDQTLIMLPFGLNDNKKQYITGI